MSHLIEHISAETHCKANRNPKRCCHHFSTVIFSHHVCWAIYVGSTVSFVSRFPHIIFLWHSTRMPSDLPASEIWRADSDSCRVDIVVETDSFTLAAWSDFLVILFTFDYISETCWFHISARTFSFSWCYFAYSDTEGDAGLYLATLRTSLNVHRKTQLVEREV